MTSSAQEIPAMLDLGSEIKAMQAAKSWPQGRSSKTLIKTGDIRVVLIALEAGAALPEHHADGGLTVQVLRGALRINASGKNFDLRAGQIVALPASLKHDVIAAEASEFLLTISWPRPAELRSMPHRSYA